MKKSYVAVLVILLSISMVGCGNDASGNNINEQVIEMVKKVEVTDMKLTHVRISYDDFIKELNPLFVEGADVKTLL